MSIKLYQPTAPAGTKSVIQKAFEAERLTGRRLESLVKSHAIGREEFEAYENRRFLAKADLVTATLASQGGTLNATQERRFIRDIIEAPTILNRCRVEIMAADKHKIAKLGIGDQVFVGGVENTEIAAGDRTSPTITEIELDASELVAEMWIPYMSLEDNLEGDAFVDTLLTQVGQRGSADLERLLIFGDKTLGTGTKLNRLLSTQDGILKQVTSYVVDVDDNPISNGVIGAISKRMPNKYRDRQNNLLFISPDDEINIRMLFANRGTALGDANANGYVAITPLGHTVIPTSQLPQGTAILSDPRNFIFGIKRRITLEVDRDIRQRKFIFVLSCRVAFAIEREDAVVKAHSIADGILI